jgi:hypothetical protein
LKPNQPIRRASGALPFALEESAEKVVARIGAPASHQKNVRDPAFWIMPEKMPTSTSSPWTSREFRRP